mmetsp:Transcript_105610/g.281297  ORF Transcript_105610/g.281297 Transcript_105610/m.281297 type:complete len:205 (-) Transcript_105610:496-1110(-)
MSDWMLLLGSAIGARWAMDRKLPLAREDLAPVCSCGGKESASAAPCGPALFGFADPWRTGPSCTLAASACSTSATSSAVVLCCPAAQARPATRAPLSGNLLAIAQLNCSRPLDGWRSKGSTCFNPLTANAIKSSTASSLIPHCSALPSSSIEPSHLRSMQSLWAGIFSTNFFTSLSQRALTTAESRTEYQSLMQRACTRSCTVK